MGLIGCIGRRIGRILLDITVLLLVVTVLPGLPPNVNYSYQEPQETLPFEGPLAKNERLNSAQRILDGKINGPESITSRAPRELFTGLHNGKILRIWGKRYDHFKIVTTIGPGCDGPWQESKCGRPLGLRFAPDGRLVVVDAYLGLFVLDVDTGEKERLFDPTLEIGGRVPKIPNDLDIDEDGNIYWSDASSVGDLSDGMVEMLSDPSGRLIKYDSKTKTNSVLVKDIHFANGVQLSPHRDFVLFCECFKSRIIRHWLNGPNAGKTDVFADRLPGKPDNIRARKNGGYYVSLIAVDNKDKVDTVAILAKLPLLRKLILRLLAIPKFFFDTISRIYPNQFTENCSYKIYHLQPIAEIIASERAVVVELDEEGNIEGSLQGDNGNVRFISETEQVGDYLFFGSPYNNYLGYLRVEHSDEEEEEEEVVPPSIEVDGKGIRMKVDEDQEKPEVEDVDDNTQQEDVDDKPEKEEVKVEEKKDIEEEPKEEVKVEPMEKDKPEPKEEVRVGSGEKVKTEERQEIRAEPEESQVKTEPEESQEFKTELKETPVEKRVEVEQSAKMLAEKEVERELEIETGSIVDEDRTTKPPPKVEL